jgi:hypothetical protein
MSALSRGIGLRKYSIKGPSVGRISRFGATNFSPLLALDKVLYGMKGWPRNTLRGWKTGGSVLQVTPDQTPALARQDILSRMGILMPVHAWSHLVHVAQLVILYVSAAMLGLSPHAAGRSRTRHSEGT